MGPGIDNLSERDANERLAERYAVSQYNLMVADLFSILPVELVCSREGQAVIRYFAARIQRHFAQDFLEKLKR